jgi:glycosyltransferase involved in cell wall biosynthesis
MAEAVTDNAAWTNAQPTLSILIPFLRDDPTRLLAALDLEAEILAGAAEIVVLDDGSADPALAAAVAETVCGLALPARFVCLSANQGRAKGRNRLAAEARGGWLLFLDSDMLPDTRRFVQTYLDLIAQDEPAVAFGGFSLDQAPPVRAHALHRRMAGASDCAPVPVRRQAPEKHVFTSNLLVRRDIFEAEAFDEAFTGWGWEDVEWAMRVSRRHPITHVDNTATHLGLDTAPAMAAKYEQSVANFARVVARHRHIVAAYPSYRVARMLKPMPLKALWRPGLKTLALARAAPLGLRALAMRLYRAALYADVV